MIEIKKNQQINAGNFLVSIGTYNETDVAIYSKSSGEFVKFKSINKSKKLKKIKRVFKAWLNSDETFTFQFMPENITIDLIKILRK